MTIDRGNMELSDFAVPETRDLPIHDKAHVRMAWNVVDNVKGLSVDQRIAARTRILRKANELDINTQSWHLQSVSFSAMALDFPAQSNDHPNKLPFTGILTRLDQPSDLPLNGTNGKCVMIPKNVAEQSLHSLLGMGIDFSPNFDSHNPRSKIGLITAATIEGNAIAISGFLYATDFPEEVQIIQAEKEKMGFSFEAQSLMQDMKSDPLVVKVCEFTGAAVLYKDKAAYHETSIAANAAQGNQMTDDEKKQLAAVVAGMAAITESITKIQANSATAIAEAVDAALKKTTPVAAASLLHMVSPHAAALRTCAANMMAAGIGCHASAGHAIVLNKMADKLEAEAAMGAIPTVFRDHDFLYAAGDTSKAVEDAVKKANDAQTALLKPILDSMASMATQIADLSAKVTASAAPAAGAVTRKTLSASDLASLKRLGLDASAEKGLTVVQVDEAVKKAALSPVSSMALKLALKDANLLAA